MDSMSTDSAGPYRLAEVLGEGGMGVVRRGISPGGRSVAVKLLRTEAVEPTALRRLAREVDIRRRVRSPFVAHIVDADLTADPPYLVTGYVPGRTLDQIVAQRGALTGGALRRLAEGLARALAAMHGAGIVHGGLDPGNVIVGENGDPTLIDFGTAQLVDAPQLTSLGLVTGRPAYLAPEVLSGEGVRAPADVHAWAGTVIFAATGRPPFGSGTFEQTIYKILQGTPGLRGVPESLVPVLREALTPDPSGRPDAADLVDLLARAGLDPAATDRPRRDRAMFHLPSLAAEIGSSAGPEPTATPWVERARAPREPEALRVARDPDRSAAVIGIIQGLTDLFARLGPPPDPAGAKRGVPSTPGSGGTGS